MFSPGTLVTKRYERGVVVLCEKPELCTLKGILGPGDVAVTLAACEVDGDGFRGRGMRVLLLSTHGMGWTDPWLLSSVVPT